MPQIALPLSFDRQFSFDNFFSDAAGFITASLKAIVDGEGESIVCLWGRAGSGKTHLINACALYARQHAVAFQLYDARQLVEFNPEQIGAFDDNAMLAVDNLDAISGSRNWEQKFYRAINRCRDQGFRLLFTMSEKPQDLTCSLADFQSRLSWSLLLELPQYEEDDIRQIISRRAQLLGIELSKEVLSYLLTHYSRRLADQMEILQLLDAASLSTKKKVSISLVKQVMSNYH
ncbi:MAG: hypothetical protein GY820_33640 [Gammaproteobacteria bacterium]|nr:hypothetical protein [Gammaproteobacteria bacterium]